MLLCLFILMLSFASASSGSKTMAPAAFASPVGQSSTELMWEKTYGGSGDDRAYYAAQTGDGGFLIVGSTTSIFPGETVAWMVRIDSNGNMLWNKNFLEGNGTEFRHVINTENGFLLVGNTFSASGTSKGIIAQTDEQGNVIWNITIGGPNINNLLSATETDDGFVFAGFTYPSGSTNSEAWVVKTTSDGNVTWNKTYGQAGDYAARTIVTAENSSCVIAGYTNSSENGVNDAWLFKIDANGTLLWSRTYGSTESQEATALTKAESGYLIVGDKFSPETDYDALMIKTDMDGNVLWQNTYGGAGFDMPYDVTSLSSGGYAITGFTFSWGQGERDFWLFKIDESGNVLWSCTQGMAKYEEAYYVHEVAESEFVMVGWTNSIGNGLYDFYAVEIKVNANDNGFFQNPALYASIGIGIAAVATVVIFVYSRRKRKKTDSDVVH